MLKISFGKYIKASVKKCITYYKNSIDESYIVSVSGNSSILEASFFPPIQLNPSKHYVIGFTDLWTFNSIPNIYEGHNEICFSRIEKEKTSGKDITAEKVITLPTGSYELEELTAELKARCQKLGISFTLKSNENTLKTTIESDWNIDFRGKNTFYDLLGFKSKLYTSGKVYESENTVKIIGVNSIKVECSIATGSYHNGQLVHTLHEFFPSVPTTYKIIESPSEVIYLPIKADSTIDNIQFRLVDQDGKLVDFRKEIISLRVHIKNNGNKL